ncbi:hypothetical protein I3843_15G127000 [Carya illinoinensis]|nr:hypothetical protein I3843_15G127000 [Carya illinoinensis]
MADPQKIHPVYDVEAPVHVSTAPLVPRGTSKSRSNAARGPAGSYYVWALTKPRADVDGAAANTDGRTPSPRAHGSHLQSKSKSNISSCSMPLQFQIYKGGGKRT